ncbi:tripartite tricarboxylate transporter TctB family protein [Pacificibacter marinus]|uniref:Tripartite tricarboxylate transporter TctB family protein n=1 Tax=Pacificibacter marinus TaxID=658057 RepID=A0A1Y5RTI6_9RHOB|nr:tripartite tricarboxylate transporter TctB family protein [Pacificibacter marinus]SEK40566.1 Tripartite tricarboxylate transporter TctB family protein [Pacificibacter marinus]SLN25088.1 Tripartite tricarboxylate transporter TctB family protein [Pacificibacter marinus]
MRVTDLTLGLLTLLGGIAIYLSAINFHAIPGQDYGAGTMPRAIAFVTGLVGVFIITKAVMAGERLPGLQLAEWTRSGSAVLRMLAVLGLIVAYIVVSPVVGFLPTAFCVMLVAMLILGVRIPTAIIVSAVTSVAIQQSFGKLLLVPLPRSDFLNFFW